MTHSALPSGPKTPRQTWIDQARWAAIVLVVVGHAVGMLRGRSDLALLVSNFVYMFHIPVFVLLAGWGARRAAADGPNLQKIFWQLIAPYIVFQLVAFGFNYVFEADDPSWSFTSQTFGLWFLVALAAWRLLAPWFRGLSIAVPLAVMLALLAGLSENIDGFLSLSRILYFLPIFLMGPWLVEKIAAWRADVRIRITGAGILLAAAIATAVLGNDFWRQPFLGNMGYEGLGVTPLNGMLWRLASLCIGTILATAFMLILPGKPGAPTRIGTLTADAGQHTMYPYLLHLPMLTVVGVSPLVDMGSSLFRSILFIACAVVFCVLVSSKPLRVLARPLVEPRWLIDRVPRRRRETTRGS